MTAACLQSWSRRGRKPRSLPRRNDENSSDNLLFVVVVSKVFVNYGVLVGLVLENKDVA